MVKTVPAPDHIALAVELHDNVTHNPHILAGSLRIGNTRGIIANQLGVSAHGQKVAIGHFMRLMMQGDQSLHRDRFGIGRLSLGTIFSIPFVDDVPQEIDFACAEVLQMKKQIAVTESFDPGDTSVGLVVPDHLALVIQPHQHAPATGKGHLGFGEPVR